jgi:hypothetical protein
VFLVAAIILVVPFLLLRQFDKALPFLAPPPAQDPGA